MNSDPERGITITTAELDSEGVELVLDAVAGTGANAVTMSTGQVVEAAPGEGMREPPLDLEGQKRMLDRPLWGKRVLNVQRYAVHTPDPALWSDLPWNPPALAPEAIRVDHVRRAIDASRERGLRVYAALAPYALPGGTGGQVYTTPSTELRDEYRPRRFIGGSHPDAIAFTGCLNNPVVRRLGRARLLEVLRHYGDVDGIVLDWVEYPVYFIDKLFTCFCDHCRHQATASGYDWQEILSSVRQLWDSLHTLTPEQVHALIDSGDWGDLVADPEGMQTGFNAWLDFKAESVALAVRDLRETMAETDAPNVHVSTGGFSLPWGRMSGASYPDENGPVDVQRVKLYSFHWLMMVRWWTEAIMSWNRGSDLRATNMTRATMSLFGLELEHKPSEITPDLFGMPDPDESHNLTPGSYTHRLENALSRRSHQAPLMPVVHAYRSVEDFASLMQTIRPFARRGVWIQRYGYLSDEKLDVLRQEWAGGR